MKAAIIITGNFDFINVRGQDIMNELGWRIWNNEKVLCFIFIVRNIHRLNPYWLNNNILMTCENHYRNTCFANNIYVVVPKPNVKTFRNSFIPK